MGTVPDSNQHGDAVDASLAADALRASWRSSRGRLDSAPAFLERALKEALGCPVVTETPSARCHPCVSGGGGSSVLASIALYCSPRGSVATTDVSPSPVQPVKSGCAEARGILYVGS